MTGYIEWKSLSQPIKSDVLPTQGNNVADYVTVTTTNTSAVAPEGAMYASVYCDVASTVEPNILSPKGIHGGETIYNAKEYFVAAGERVEIPNIIVGKTTLTVTDV